MASFWDNLGPGMLRTGGEFLLGQRAAGDAENRMRRAQGPLYDQMIGQAGKSLSLAGGMDPAAMAADRFKQQQALVAPGDEAARLKLMRELQAKGMLGTASFEPVAGTVPSGVALNPQMAALLAAQEGAKAQASYRSLDEGEQYLDNLLRRGGTLQSGANQARAQGQVALQTIPKRQSPLDALLKSGVGLLKNKETAKALPGMFRGGMDWLRNIGKPPSYDFSRFDMSQNDDDNIF